MKYSFPVKSTVNTDHNSSANRGAVAPNSLSVRCFALLRCGLMRVNDANVVKLVFILGVTSTLMMPQLPTWRPLLVVTLICLAMCLKSKLAVPLVIFILGLSLASIKFNAHTDRILPNYLERKDIEVVANIVGLPQFNGGDAKFLARIESARWQNSSLPSLHGKTVKLSCYRCPVDILPSESWQFTVRMKKPNGYASAGAFDYEKYLFRHQIIATGYVRLKSGYQRIDQRKYSVNSWRMRIRNSLDRLVPDAEFSKAAILALSIGDKSAFTAKHRQVLQQSGLSHLFAISGLHVGLMFAVVMVLAKLVLSLVPRIFERWPRPFLVLPPALIAAFVYAAMAGFAVSTQRAIIMLSVFVLCRLACRSVNLLKVLLIAATIIVINDPFSVLDAGFWLSCGAVMIIHLASVGRDGLAPLSLLKLQPLLWLGMLPLTLIFFGQVSLISPVVNLIAVPLFCLLLIPATLMATVLGELGLTSIAGGLFQWLCYTYDLIFFILTRLVEHPFAVLSIGRIDAIMIPIIGLILILGFRKYTLSLLVWPVVVVCLTAFSQTQRDASGLKLSVLDVGQGLSVVIQTEQGVTVYDTGPKYSSGFSAAKAVLIPYLKHHQIRRLKRVIISHADNDHIGGFNDVKDAFSIEQLLTSRPDKIPNSLPCVVNQSWLEGQTKFQILSPDDGTPSGSNNRSCVLKISHGSTSILLTADIEKRVERYLISNEHDVSANILLVPHQGSKTSSTPDFIDAVAPEVALVAAGYRNHYGHPHNDVLKRYDDRGIQVLSTITGGTLEIEVGKRGYTVSPFRAHHRRFWHRR